MRVVLDTNGLLVSIARKSRYRPIFDAFLKRRFTLIVSTEILAEYAEIIERRANSVVATNVLELLVSKSNAEKKEIYFRWKLIASDPDDDKFVDAAVAGGADFIVTNDGHFDELKAISFPFVPVLNLEDFLTLLTEQKPD